MKYIFDSSSIFRAIKENLVEVLPGNFTLRLARYELGNVLWKEFALLKTLNDEEVKRLISIVRTTLEIMEEMDIDGHEDEILKTAAELSLTFYDASYVYLANEKGVPLVTEDAKLSKKAASYIKIVNLAKVKEQLI